MDIVALHKKGGRGWLTVCVVTISVLLFMLSSCSFRSSTSQKAFSSPEEAVISLVAAVRANNENEILAILGPGSRELISSGDEVADRTGREKFLIAYDRMNTLQQGPDNTMVLHIGADNWALPIPIMKKGTQWIFDTGKGKEEILNRRIGRNELHVIDVLDAYVDAQHEYATRDYGSSTGIGLALVKKIVQEQGGEITLDSDTGKGASFRFTWPKHPDGAAGAR